MKKIILAAILAVCAIAVSAQPRAIGGRLGYNFDVSYQHSVGEKNFIEVDAGLLAYSNGIHATAIYDWICLSPQWTEGTWNLYAGVGANVGYWWGWGYYSYKYVLAGVVGQVGLEYIFPNLPLQISVDYRPSIGVQIGTNGWYSRPVRFDTSGSSLGDVAVSVRYVF